MPSTSLARIEPLDETLTTARVEERAGEIVTQLHSLKSSLVSNFLSMGDLLLEVKQNNYHVVLGYENFQEWLDASMLDIRISQAYYMMRIVSKAAYLDIPRAELEQCTISGLKEIASLDEDSQGDKIKELVEYAKTHSAKDTTKQVDRIKLESGQELYTLKAFRVPNIVLEEVIEPAIERMQLEYGQTIDSESGDVIEISDGKALEMICANYLSGSLQEM